MNLSLDNNVNKLVLVVVLGAVALIVINISKNKLGKQVSVFLSLVVILLSGYFGYNLLMIPTENFEESPSPINTREHFNENEGNVFNHFSDQEDEAEAQAQAEAQAEAQAQAEAEAEAQAQAQAQAEAESNSVVSENNSNNKAVLNHEVLLPCDTTSDFAKNNPNTAGDICTKNFLNSGHHIGINTQGCSLRNSNRGLRSEPPNPQVQVSPWLQTTICPDLTRKHLDGPQ
jgi:hypothetical protein